MRQLNATLGVAFLGIGLLAGCGKGDGSKPATSNSTPTGSGAGAKADLPVTAEVKGIYICCATCEKDVQTALGKVAGVGDIHCDVKKRVVTYKAKDGTVANNGEKALNAAGFGGVLKHNGSADTQFTVIGRFLGDFSTTSEFRIKDVHVCCEGCEKEIKAAFQGMDVTFAGTGSQKEVIVKGKDLNVSTVMGTLIDAGFYGNPMKK